MAAEVALGHPYNSKCDVYSFALLVWELLNLEKPFGRVSMHTLKQRVWNETKQRRPRIIIASDNPNHDVATIPQAAWTKQLKDLIERAWAHDPSKRPTMHEMETELRTELTYSIEVMNNVYGVGNDPFLESKRMSHDARRSTFVYQPDARGSIDGDSKQRKKISQKTDASRSAWFHSSGQRKRGGWSSARNLNNNRQDSSFTQLLSRRNSEISRTILNKE